MSMIGKTLGTFTLEALIGKGGMGEVYRAKDQKLGRDVAIKVLPEEFAKDTDRVARFQREAKLLASLNHPNIAAIHGLEESEGTHFLVLELIEGDTLADPLKRGAIPVEEALKLALQIAEALEAAHDKGVIHRDLKPANIKVTPDGKVKVLDFGLAKAFTGDSEDMNLSNSPTLSAAATQQGVILGTAAYMSPEQARGNPVDKRADIWAFGVVLFEILTGFSTFSENTVSDTLASVLKTEPEWKSLPPNLHPRIRFLLERCLKKEPKDRYHDIADARVDIQEALMDPEGLLAPSGIAVTPRTRFRMMLPWVAATFLFTSIIAGMVFWLFSKTPPKPLVTRFSVDLEERPNTGEPIAISPDGRCFVYSANGQLYLHSFDQLDTKAIPGTEEGSQPFFSPDGKSIAFFTPSQLKTVALTGVAPVVLSEIGEGSAQGLVGVWDSQNRIFFGQSGPFGLSLVSASGGTPTPFAKLEDHADFDYPEVLPSGEWVLFTDLAASGSWSNANIVAQSVKTGERKLLIKGGHFARYIQTGHLIYAQNSNLFAIGFDAKRIETIGNAVPVVQGIGTNEGSGHAQFAIAKNGTLIYIPASAITPSEMVWIDKEGKEQLITAEPNNYLNPRISPDGTRVALAIESRAANKDIWIWDFIRETMTRFTFDEAIDDIPIWTPDGKRIAFTSNRDGLWNVYWQSADGTGAVEQLITESGRAIFPSCWSADGNFLALMESASNFDIGVLQMEDKRERQLLLQEKFGETQPQISPNGSWLAYMSNESGRYEIYVRPFPNVNEGKWQVSTKGGRDPRWAQDGMKLYYRNGDVIMMAPIKTEPSFSRQTPKNLFQGVRDRTEQDFWTYWDISPDGSRILSIKESKETLSSDKESRPKVIVVLNWLEELKERVPTE